MTQDPMSPDPQTQTWHILVVDDDQGRRAIALDAVTFSVGRDANNSIVLHSTAISRQHAILLRLPRPEGGYRFRILDGDSQGRQSKNGITVNGRATLSHDLSDGDLILFGGKVKAQYCIRQLALEDFQKYLHSVNYRSVKVEIQDPRLTVVPGQLQFKAQNPSSPDPQSNSQSSAAEPRSGASLPLWLKIMTLLRFWGRRSR